MDNSKKKITSIPELVSVFLNTYTEDYLPVKDDNGNLVNVPVSVIQRWYDRMSRPLTDAEIETMHKVNALSSLLQEMLDDKELMQSDTMCKHQKIRMEVDAIKAELMDLMKSQTKRDITQQQAAPQMDSNQQDDDVLNNARTKLRGRTYRKKYDVVVKRVRAKINKSVNK